ncbi:MerR family transcriptional regulator [Cytobacillus sp. IB215316]|uniref:MerR family transcriptional regulator n=1 Tax=Cytobacillus sp. IB215316 TaxID=3097354 RepID=UPI002A12E232|nr:MerR family transcriptional regulator [Cytobacillus sp. IB215316]MDX8360707.1 MerR family transcriptional regulator [Cytobacillus sp. IB215316]
MKIGQFANENNISIDTIRHYMDMGLITPEKTTGQYQFGERCQEDLKDIIYLKNLGFKLSEIKTIYQYRRIGKLSSLQYNQYYKRLFEEKFVEIDNKIIEYEKIKSNLQAEIDHFDTTKNQVIKQMGMKLSAVSLLECKECQQEINIIDGDIQNNQILNGVLQCNCNEQYLIKDGILFTSTTIKDSYKLRDQKKVINEFSDFMYDYIKETDEQFIDNVYKSLDWSYSRVDFEQLQYKNILHLGTGIGTSLRYIYESLPQDCLYIALEPNYKKMQVLKSILESYETQKNILFICSDFLNIPIKQHSIDFLIDTGTSTYSLNHEEFLLQKVQGYLKEHSHLMGSYVCYENFHINNNINREFRKNFQLEVIKEKIESLNFERKEETTFTYIESHPGRYELNILKGEKTYNYLYIGKRLG